MTLFKIAAKFESHSLLTKYCTTSTTLW